MMSAYLAFLLSSAADAADQASVLLVWTYGIAKVMGMWRPTQDINPRHLCHSVSSLFTTCAKRVWLTRSQSAYAFESAAKLTIELDVYWYVGLSRGDRKGHDAHPQ